MMYLLFQLMWYLTFLLVIFLLYMGLTAHLWQEVIMEIGEVMVMNLLPEKYKEKEMRQEKNNRQISKQTETALLL